MTSQPSVWKTDWSVAPGEILAEELEARGISQSELARRMGRPIKTINEIVNTKAALTPETALQLELAIGIPARLWTSLEADYRGHLAREHALESLAGHELWAKRFPLADLRRHKLIDPGLAGGELVAALLAFFGVSSVDVWEQRWGNPVAAFRHSPTFSSEPPALAAWLRWGERHAASVDPGSFSADGLRTVLESARQMTPEEPLSDVLEDLEEMLLRCGVVLALTPGLKGAAVSGATRWLANDRALIQLSMRYRTNDHLWFSFFHEAAHLLEPKHEDRLDAEGAEAGASDDETERRVDAHARDLLLPPTRFSEFVSRQQFDEESVRGYAESEGVAAGIVVGRLQHDGYVRASQLNHLKRSVEWT